VETRDTESSDRLCGSAMMWKAAKPLRAGRDA
jgi:hypothetical protein